MATWDQMSIDSLRASRDLARLKNHRSAINRAYYAAFSAITHEIRKKTTDFPEGYEHPPHRQIGRYVKKHLTHLPHMSKGDRDDLRDAIKRLYSIRVSADYRQDAVLGDIEVKEAISDAIFVLESLGIQ